RIPAALKHVHVDIGCESGKQNFDLSSSGAPHTVCGFVARLLGREIGPQSRIRRHFLRSAKVLGDVVTSGRGFAHHALLQATSEEAWLDPHGARRTTTVLSWGFREQGWPSQATLTFP